MIDWKPLIVCDGDCGFNHLIILVNHLVYDLIIVSTIFATIGFTYIGIKLLTAGGDEGAMKAAKESLWSILKGFFFILVAWLLIYTITNALLDPAYSLLGPPQ
jgi:hypothetical protein